MTEIGIDTFGDVTNDPSGRPLSHAQVIRNVVDEAVLAEASGLDVVGIGEHHRPDFAVSVPDMVLAGIATRTSHLRLASSVTVLSSDDPVRVFQRFSTLDALSHGRADVVLGRGSFTESFPLFGYSLDDYATLFEEKLELFMRLREETPLTWQGKLTQDLHDVTVYPSVETGPLSTWIAVGGSPESVVRAASYGLPLMLAVIGGPHERFAPFAELHRRALEEYELPPQRVGFHSWGHVAATDEQAAEELYPAWLEMVTQMSTERGWAPPSRAQFNSEISEGAMMVGAPETVARKIANALKVLGADRFTMKVSAGRLGHQEIMGSIELLGTRVAPLVRDMLA